MKKREPTSFGRALLTTAVLGLFVLPFVSAAIYNITHYPIFIGLSFGFIFVSPVLGLTAHTIYDFEDGDD